MRHSNRLVDPHDLGYTVLVYGMVESLRVEFPAACGVSSADERIYP
jgi:hypothetical protein